MNLGKVNYYLLRPKLQWVSTDSRTAQHTVVTQRGYITHLRLAAVPIYTLFQADLEEDGCEYYPFLSTTISAAPHLFTYITIGHVFNIGKETADKATGQFVNAILKVFRTKAVR
jgi:hypothetical protein